MVAGVICAGKGFFSQAAGFLVAFSFVFAASAALAAPAAKKKPVAASKTPAPAVQPGDEKSGEKSEETYQDLIQKAQNLTLQQDRLQTSQVLIRGIQRENRGSLAYRELVRV